MSNNQIKRTAHTSQNLVVYVLSGAIGFAAVGTILVHANEPSAIAPPATAQPADTQASATKLASADLVLKLVGTIAVVGALFLNWRAHTERTTFEVIDRIYSLGSTWLGQSLKDWTLAHLLSIGAEDYLRTKSLVAKGITDDNSREALRVKERLLAIQILVAFEQVYFQFENSGRFQWARKRFLHKMLKYFTERVIRNPRLVGFLQSDPTGTTLHLEPETARYLQMHLDAATDVDRDGPFAETIATDE